MPFFIRSRPLAYRLHFRSEPSILPYDRPSPSFTAAPRCIRLLNRHSFPKALLGEYKYIKPTAQAVKRLLSCNFKGTIRLTMQRYFVAPQDQKFPIRISENNYEEHKSGNQKYGFLSAYRQIFLFAIRHFYGLSEARPFGHSRYTKPRKMHDPRKLWSRFKKLAFSLDFVLPGHHPFSRPTQHPPEFTVVHTFLTRLRPPEFFEYNSSILAQLSSHVASVLAQMKECRVTRLVPFLSLDIEEDWSLQKRCGMTDIDTFFSDQKYLFFHNIYCRPNDPRRQSLTSFAVKRDMFLAFFPEFCEDPDMAGTDSPSDERPSRFSLDANRNFQHTSGSPGSKYKHDT